MSATHPLAAHRMDWATLPVIGTLLAVPTLGTLLLMYDAARGPCETASCPDTPTTFLVTLVVLNLLVTAALWAWPRHRAYDPARRAAFAAVMLLVVASVYGPALI